MEKKGSNFWSSIIRKVNKIKPLTLPLEHLSLPELKAKSKGEGVLSDDAENTRMTRAIRYPDNIETPEDVHRIGNKRVIMTEKKPLLAPLAQLESDFDFAFTKLKVNDPIVKTDLVNDVIVKSNDGVVINAISYTRSKIVNGLNSLSLIDKRSSRNPQCRLKFRAGKKPPGLLEVKVQQFQTIPEIGADVASTPCKRQVPLCCNGHRCLESCYREEPTRTVATCTSEATQPNQVPREIWVNDVATLTERALAELYVPFEAVRGVLIKQARDILLCRFSGDYCNFESQFLTPASFFLEDFTRQHDRYHSYKGSFTTEVAGSVDYEECQIAGFKSNRFCQRRVCRESERRGCNKWIGWPLCYDRKLLVHLGELDSGLLQRRGDFYFYLRAKTDISVVSSQRPAGNTPSQLQLRNSPSTSQACPSVAPSETSLELALRYRVHSGTFQERTVSDYETLLEIMEWSADVDSEWPIQEDTCPKPGSTGYGESDDQHLSNILRNLLVAVERGIERLDWDKMKVNSKPVHAVHERKPVNTRDCSVQTSPTEEVRIFKDENFIDKQNDLVDSESKDANFTVDSSVTSRADEVVEVPEEAEEQDDGYHDNTLCQPTTISQVNQDLLHSELACLTGSRDKCGRSLVYLFLDKLIAVDKNINDIPSKLAEFLVYFGMIPKTEVSKRGLVVLVDCGKASVDTCNVLDEAFSLFEANEGSCIHSVLLWISPNNPVNQEFPATPFPNSGVQFEIVKSQDELLRLISRDQLLKEFSGSYAYDHQEWIGFRKFLEPFVNGCRLSGRHLVSVMRELTRGVGHLPLVNASSTRQLIERQKRHIHSTYQDEQLRHLEEEGETILRELRHYSAGAPHNQDYKDALDHSAVLYGELRRAMNKLSKLADKRLKKLEECLHIKTLAEESSQVLSWLCRRGEESLAKHQMVAESLPAIKEQEEEFEKFYFLAMRQIEKGNDLLEEAALVSPTTTPVKNASVKEVVKKTSEPDNVNELTTSLKDRLNSFSERLEETRERLEDTAKCYHLLDEVYEWALSTMNFVSEMKLDRVPSSTAEYEDILRWTKALEDYLDDHPPIADEVFREMTLLAKTASSGSSPKLILQCQTAQARCQETVELVRARRTSLMDAGKALAPDSIRLRRDSSSSDGQHKDWDPSPNPNKTTRSRSHPQNFWPRGSSTPSSTCSGSARNAYSACSEDGFDSPSNFFRQQNYSRRRSMSAINGPPSGFTSPFASYTSFPSNPFPTNPLSTPRDCALQMDQYLRDKEEQLQSRGLITEDLTTRGPVASIEKDDSRWSHNNVNQNTSPSSEDGISPTMNVPLPNRSSTGSRLATKGSPPPTTSTSSLHPVTQKPVKKHMRICPTWQLCEEALQKAAQQVRRQNERLDSQHKLGDENEEDELGRFPDNASGTLDCSPLDDSSGSTPLSSSSISSTVESPIPVNSHLKLDVNVGSCSKDQDSTDSNKTYEVKNTKSKTTLMLIMGELIQTERDYVKSLEYIIENYCPELLREDIPQALRGQRNVIFGNIEKIYEFHSQYFLHELELCESSPFRVGQYFLQYERQFYLYALYNKNKPKSDNLMSEYGTAFFRQKQLELKDKMDLASYLLKPVQRMGKYALLLKQLLKECPEVDKESEHQDLKAAEEMVRFQLRHGNDLLAMDALRDCDVNVKEQGRLLRQDEFLVWQGRYRKSLRRVFLFEDLILFSKARRDPDQRGLQEIYQYKQSIKTTDIGMTEQIGDSPTKFEIWFRKRKLHDTYILQAASSEVKQAWAHEISRVLWKQALKNREIRLAEMSSMGIGNKPCLDIKPSEDQINDRSIRIDSVPKATRFRNSIAVSASYDQLRTNKRPHSIISVSSSSSSGSSCGNNNVPGTGFNFYGAALNLGFEPGDSPRSHHRSVTQQSQCSTESGFCTDTSLMGDQILLDSDSNSRFGQSRCRRKAERSDSVLSNDSVTTQAPTSLDEFETSRTECVNTIPPTPSQEQTVNTPM